jgi:hypothetical protein
MIRSPFIERLSLWGMRREEASPHDFALERLDRKESVINPMYIAMPESLTAPDEFRPRGGAGLFDN